MAVPILPMLCMAATGLLTAAAFFPLGLSWLVLVSLVPAWAAIHRKGTRRGALLGALAACIGCGVAFHWIVPLLMRFAHLSWPLALLGFLAWLSWEALAVACWGAVWGMESESPWLEPVRVFAPVLIERFWPRLFPWHFGDPLVELPLLSQVADLGGVTAATLVVVAVNYGLYRLWAWARRRTAFPLVPAASAGLLLAFDLGYGAYRLAHPPVPDSEADVVLLHLAMPIKERHAALDDPRLYDAHRRRLAALAKQALAAGPADLVVLPEAVLNAEPGEEPSGFAEEVGAPVLYGARVRPKGGGRPHFNSAVLEYGGRARTYNKSELLLLGERVPLSDHEWVRRRTGLSSMDRGDGAKLLDLRGAGLGPLVCYEAILPGYVRSFARLGAKAFVNVTEDGWYGWTGEPYQHLLLSRMRAVEDRRWLLRCVNNGITAAVDPMGRLAASDWDRERPGFARARVGLLSVETVYARWGGWLAWALLAASLACLAAARTARLQ